MLGHRRPLEEARQVVGHGDEDDGEDVEVRPDVEPVRGERERERDETCCCS